MQRNPTLFLIQCCNEISQAQNSFQEKVLGNTGLFTLEYSSEEKKPLARFLFLRVQFLFLLQFFLLISL